jgi:transposase InsO family protein
VNVYPFIEAEKARRRNVTRACELLKVSRAAFYACLSGPSGRDQDDADLAAKIQAVHEESKRRYGAPRVHAELRRRGQRHGRKRVARLMRSATLSPPGTRTQAWSSIPTVAASSAEFADLATDYQVVLSLGRTGQCWDNALAESFFASLKGELIDLQAWPTRAGGRRAIVVRPKASHS